MRNSELIIKLINEKLEGTDKFLVDITVTPDNRIHVYLDGDHGLTIQDCTDFHRFLESELDRDVEDFELIVSSAGLNKGFQVRRQYEKNIGKDIQLMTNNEEKITGKLLSIEGEVLEIEKKTERKKKSQSAGEEEKKIKILFNDIKEAKALISFKK
jgi:ribosome maturation factor RimP